MNLILFDGVCNLCNGFVQFVIQRDSRGFFRFASLQSETAKELMLKNGADPEKMDSVLFFDGTVLYHKSEAVLQIAKGLKGFGWLTYLRILPLGFRDVIYDLVARSRYRLFGRRNECMIPTPELRSRFLD